MQTNKLKNLIISLYYATNNNIKHYYIVKSNKSIKHIKINTQTLTSIYKQLYKNYKCNLKTLNTIQYLYSNVNLTKYYNTFTQYCKVTKTTVKNTNKIKQFLTLQNI